MKIQLTESKLKAIISESVRMVLNEIITMERPIARNGQLTGGYEKITGMTMTDIEQQLRRNHPNWSDDAINRILNNDSYFKNVRGTNNGNNNAKKYTFVLKQGINGEDYDSVLQQVAPNLFQEMQAEAQGGSPIQWKKLSLNGLRLRRDLDDNERGEYENKYALSNYGYLIWISNNMRNQPVLNVSKPYLHTNGYAVNIYPDSEGMQHRNLSAISLVRANFGNADDISRVFRDKTNSNN